MGVPTIALVLFVDGAMNATRCGVSYAPQLDSSLPISLYQVLTGPQRKNPPRKSEPSVDQETWLGGERQDCRRHSQSSKPKTTLCYLNRFVLGANATVLTTKSAAFKIFGKKFM